MNPLRIGVIGIGNIGTLHARNLFEKKITNAELAAICDANPAALDRFPQVKHFTSPDELIASGVVDAVIVSVPHYDHVPVGKMALAAGLHVLMEKPIAVHKAVAEELIAAHTDKKLVFGAMFDTRTEPRYIKLRELIRSGELGPIRRINWIITTWFRSDAYYASSGWRATWAGEGGGMLVNQLPHDLDLLQWMFGLPKRVRAFCPIGKFHPIEVEDEVNAILEYADGATAVLVASTGEAPGSDRREIVGDRGRVIVHADHLEFTRTEVSTAEFCRTTTEGFARPGSWDIRIPITGTTARHATVLQAFVDAVHNGTPLVAEAHEGLASVELANAIILSSQEDRTVELPLDAGAYDAFLQKKITESTPKSVKPSVAAAPAGDMAKSFQ